MSTVSIIIPAYNRGYCLPETIESVLKQTYRDYEIILVDDGSDDDTEKIAAAYKGENFVSVRHPVNLGVSAARNTGIRKAQGEFISFLDSDDFWRPQKLERQLALFDQSSSELGLVYTDVDFLNVPTGVVSHYQRPFVRGRGYELMLEANRIVGGGSSVMIRKTCLDHVGYFDEKMSSSEDWDLWLRISKYFLIDYCDEKLVICRTQQDNASADMSKMIAGREYLFQKHSQGYARYPDLRALQYYKLGIYCLKNGFRKRGRNHFYTAFSVAPAKRLLFKARCLLQYGFSLLNSSSYLFIRRLLIGNE